MPSSPICYGTSPIIYFVDSFLCGNYLNNSKPQGVIDPPKTILNHPLSRRCLAWMASSSSLDSLENWEEKKIWNWMEAWERVIGLAVFWEGTVRGGYDVAWCCSRLRTSTYVLGFPQDLPPLILEGTQSAASSGDTGDHLHWKKIQGQNTSKFLVHRLGMYIRRDGIQMEPTSWFVLDARPFARLLYM